MNTSLLPAKERFLNRELSWLEFNMRVLEEAENPSHPLLERVKFLSISSSNLDEFFMVRVAGLKDQMTRQPNKKSPDELTANEQLIKIKDKSEKLTQRQQTCLQALKEELAREHIQILSKEELTEDDLSWLKNHYTQNIFPALSPIAVDPAHPFPFLPNLSLTILVETKKGDTQQLSVLPLPTKIERFINIPHRNHAFILLEDCIELFISSLFPDDDIQQFNMFRITRDSDLELEDEADDLVQNFESAVKKRRRGNVIRLRTASSIPNNTKSILIKELGVHKDDVVQSTEMLGLSHLAELYDCPRNDLKFKPYEERSPERINDYEGDCFAAIAEKDIVIHHPYETFDVVVSFLEQAAKDPDVVAIKQTLYRTSNESPIVKALIEAAEAGKSVTVVVELKARFDEEANIRWARDLERAGAQVIFGFVELKTHAKISLVVRRENNQLKSYVHFGTGNYHPITAKIYSDLSFFTADVDFCVDASHVFNYLTGYSPPEKLSYLSMSPHNLRNTLLRYIDVEIANAKAGKPAAIWAKLNSLVDTKIIDALYKASQANVQIDLIVRGICTLRPGVKGLSDNIRVKTIIGRFLEHTRMVCFANGHELPSDDAKLFISSADWMPRNFDRRIEILVPILNPTVHEQILGQILVANIKDKKQSWVMQSDGSYVRETYQQNDFCAHDYFMSNPSLSGRGKAIKHHSDVHELCVDSH